MWLRGANLSEAPMTQLSARQSLLLSSVRVGHLATADMQGSPHVVPVCFAAGAESIYSVLDQKPKRASLTRLRRVKNIQTNPQVTLLVDHYEEDWSRLWYIMVEAAANCCWKGKSELRPSTSCGLNTVNIRRWTLTRILSSRSPRGRSCPGVSTH